MRQEGFSGPLAEENHKILTETGHWHGIGRKFDILADVKIVNGLDQSNASDLEQIINIFLAAGKTLDDAENQTEIAFDVLLSGFLVAF